MCVGLEFAGESVHALIGEQVSNRQAPAIIAHSQSAEQCSNMFFEEFKPVVF
jgi:hypothetical protein